MNRTTGAVISLLLGTILLFFFGWEDFLSRLGIDTTVALERNGTVPSFYSEDGGDDFANPTLIVPNAPRVLVPPSLEVPTDVTWVRNLGHYSSSRVHYLRDVKNITDRARLGDCGRTLDVLAWLMDEVNKRPDSFLTVAYGQLLHLNREGDFVNSANGRFFDDDIDMTISVKTFAHVASLEGELFRRFGWTIRAFVSRDNRYLIFAQMVASCGHIVGYRPGKAVSSEPGIELYFVATIPGTVGGVQANIVKDLWQGTTFPEFQIFPVERKTLNSSGTPYPLHLQLPYHADLILECLYGNWRVYSPRHSAARNNCFKFF